MVSAYMFISAAQRDLLAGLDLTQERVFVRHNLIPARHLQASPTRTQPASTVIYAGRLDEAKGVRLLMAGWDHYLTTNPNPGLTLTIAGAGTLGPEITTWAATRPTVHLAGHADPARCAELMSSARAVLLPSAWAEPFGLVAIEAMALGVPPSPPTTAPSPNSSPPASTAPSSTPATPRPSPPPSPTSRTTPAATAPTANKPATPTPKNSTPTATSTSYSRSTASPSPTQPDTWKVLWTMHKRA